MVQLWRVTKPLKDLFWGALSKACKFRPEDHLVIFSEPRGGGTWVAEVLAQVPRTAILWEPLHLGHANHFSKLGFGWRQFIPEHEAWPEARQAFDQLFRGKVFNSWLCHMSSPLDWLRADRMLVKFCRAGGQIPWLVRMFDFRYKPIHLMRHPFAVVASQLKHPSWDTQRFEGYKIPDCPYNEPYLEHHDFLSSLTTREEALVATWCLPNTVPLRNAGNNKAWMTVYYEHLLTDPEQEFGRIFHSWGLPMPERAMEQVGIPSRTALEATFLKSAESQLTKWTRVFDRAQIERMAAVLEYFEIREYGPEPMPRVGD